MGQLCVDTTGCMIQPDGVWDLPQALTLMSNEAGVTMEPVTTVTHIASSTSAVPAESVVTQPTQTSRSRSTTMTSHLEIVASPTHSQSDAPTSTSDIGFLAAAAEAIASWASLIGGDSTSGDPHTFIIATVVNISSHTCAQVSSNPPHVVVANAELTSTFAAGDPALSPTRVLYSIGNADVHRDHLRTFFSSRRQFHQQEDRCRGGRSEHINRPPLDTIFSGHFPRLTECNCSDDGDTAHAYR